MLKVALLGATSHVAKNLIYQNTIKSQWSLYLFVRDKDKMVQFLKEIKDDKDKNIFLIDNFQSSSTNFDAVINCVGYGTPNRIKNAGIDLFYITESIDNLILKYLEKKPKTVYVNFSSGAVYGSTLDKPVYKTHQSVIGIQPLEDSEFYRIAKLNSEAKHRSLKYLNIIDLRLFSFFSRFIDLKGKFLLTEIVDSLLQKKSFRTSKVEIFRDYISPVDLFNLVHSCVISKGINTYVDTYSKNPISKSVLLRELTENFGLIVEYSKTVESSPTGLKSYYYSSNKDAFKLLGYDPERGSKETLFDEINALLK